MTCYRHQGKWRYDFTVKGARYRDSGFETKQEAKAAEAEARKKIGKINTDFLKLCTSRLEEIELKRTNKHFRENKTIIKNLIVRWGTKKEVTRDDVENYLMECAKQSPNKANKHLILIKALFNHGIDREWFSYNPAGKVKPYPIAKRRKYIPPQEDVVKVLEVANPMERLYLLVTIYTLARISEINRLKWSDIYDDYLILMTRKSKNSDLTERAVPMNDLLKKTIMEIPQTSKYVFTSPQTGGMYYYRSNLMKGLCKKAGVTRFGYHSLRHFGASLLASKNVPATDIQTVLGHSELTTTNIYLQSLRQSLKEATKHLEVIK